MSHYSFYSMKNLTFLIGIVFLLLFGSCSSPIDYNVSIMNEIEKVEKGGAKQAKASLEKLEKMSAFRGDDAFWQAAIEFVKFYDELFSDENQETFDAQRGIEVKQNLIKEQ